MAPEAPTETAGSVTSADGTQLAFRAWPAADPILTFAVVHGLGDHAGRYERFARGMARFGMATYALDLRGHGRSPGQRGHVDSWSQWMEDAASFVAHVESEAAGEVVPVGHSFGGVVMLSTVLAGKLPHAMRFVVSSPALRLRLAVPSWKITLGNVASKLTPRLAMGNEIDASTISRLPEVVEAYRSDPLVHAKISSRMYTEWRTAADDVLARAAQIKIPFLILAGTDDQLIDPGGSQELHERSRAMSELRLLPGRYHEPFNDKDNEEVFAMIEQWLRK